MTRIYSHKITVILLALSLIGIVIAGCSAENAPTAPSSHQDMGPWNPAPGEQIVPGRDIPFLAPGYWENGYGYGVNPLSSNVRAVIGPDGGTVRLGNHVLIVPRGAVDSTITFTMAYASGTVVAVDCGPSPFRFKTPVTLCLSLLGTQLESRTNGADGGIADPLLNSLRIFYMESLTKFEVQSNSRFDPSRKAICAEIDHFSRYIIG